MELAFYQSSNKSSTLGFLMVVLTVGILTVFLGYLYNAIITFIPLIYVNFLVTTFTGVIVGYSVQFTARFFKIRNRARTMILAFLMGLLTWLFQWVAFIAYLEYQSNVFDDYLLMMEILVYPDDLWKTILYVNKVGTWAISDIQFTDYPLWGIWFMETLLLIGVPTLVIFRMPIIPFSEKLSRWYGKRTLKHQFRM
ncbi:MAG: hypothetical protein AAF740_12740, partial [Bacteroidota bacterium]